MRQERTVQATVFNIFAEHEIGRELNAISQWLDEQRWLLGLIAVDLRGHGIKETGRHGLPAEAVLRCALLKLMVPSEIAHHTDVQSPPIPK
jgi:transposase, IS5 family